jgi:hypothetical protein
MVAAWMVSGRPAIASAHYFGFLFFGTAILRISAVASHGDDRLANWVALGGAVMLGFLP